MNGLQGICYVFFSSTLVKRTPCQKMLYRTCYILDSNDSFPIHLPLDEDENFWVMVGCEDRFNIGHERARLFLNFQCDICWFRNLMGQDSITDNLNDNLS